MPVYLRGMREASRAFAAAERDARLELRRAFRGVAEPVQKDAEDLGRETIPRTTLGRNNWWRMRVGVTRTVVYVAPRQRGARGRDNPRRRPRFGDLLMSRAMEPALDRNAAEIEHGLEVALDKVADHFNH